MKTKAKFISIAVLASLALVGCGESDGLVKMSNTSPKISQANYDKMLKEIEAQAHREDPDSKIYHINSITKENYRTYVIPSPWKKEKITPDEFFKLQKEEKLNNNQRLFFVVKFSKAGAEMMQRNMMSNTKIEGMAGRAECLDENCSQIKVTPGFY